MRGGGFFPEGQLEMKEMHLFSKFAIQGMDFRKGLSHLMRGWQRKDEICDMILHAK